MNPPMTGRRVLQRVVLPADRDMDVLPLYIDRDKAQLDIPKNLPAAHVGPPPIPVVHTERLQPQAILDRHRIRLEGGQRVSFGTYFNAFPASYWRMWTIVTDVVLQVSISGTGARVIVYRSMPDGRSQRVASDSTGSDERGDFSFELPLQPFADGGWYWFDVVAGTDAAVVEHAAWTADIPVDRVAPGSVTVGITTMNRPSFCAALLTQIGSDPKVTSLLDEVIVVEQGTQKVSDDPGFVKAEASLSGKLRVIEQGNIGGSGGFARAQAETLRAGTSKFVLFLDDDIVAEPESILRAATFGDLARRPTIVGGHMFSLYSRSRLHSFGEVINRWRFWWESAPTVVNDWDFGERNLRSARWLHRRVDVDYTGWFMCLIPTEVVREIGLSLPLFIKWDDSEYGVRAAEHGYPTVTLPGAAVWHVPWTDKNDALDWQSYFHNRNRTIAALLHSPHEHGGRIVRESFTHQVKHLFSMQYSTAALRHLALEDVLAGPQQLHADLLTKLPELRMLRSRFSDAQTAADPDAFPRAGTGTALQWQDPTARIGKVRFIKAATKSALRQLKPMSDSARERPEARLAAMDAAWWMIAAFDSVVVTMPDGASAAWHQRDPELFRDLLRRTVAIHQRLYREWPELSKRYRDALPDLVSLAQWHRTFENSVEEPDR